MNASSGRVSLTDPSAAVAGVLLPGGAGRPGEAVVAYDVAALVVEQQQQQQQQQQVQVQVQQSSSLLAPHDAEPAWPPHDAEPQVTCDV